MTWFSENPLKAKLLFALNLLIFTFILLLITELGLGYIHYKNKYASLSDSDQRYIRLRENPPNMDVEREISEANKKQYNIINLQEDKYRLRTDENGFVQPSKIHNDADVEVFFIGGSTTECKALSEELRFPYLTGRLLEENTGLKVNSYNAGVSGNHSFHSINSLLNKIIPYHPKIAVLMNNVNDVALVSFGSYWSNSMNKSLIINSKTTGTALPETAPFFFPVLKQLVGEALAKYSEEEWEHDYTRPPTNELKYAKSTGEHFQIDTKEIIRQYENSLITFIKVCRTWNIVPVLMTQVILDQKDVKVMSEIPSRIDLTMPEDPMTDPGMLSVMYSFQDTFNNVIRNVAAAEEVLLIDLKNLVPSGDHRYIYDRFHYNDSGSVLVSSLIADKLQGIILNDSILTEDEKQPLVQ